MFAKAISRRICFRRSVTAYKDHSVYLFTLSWRNIAWNISSLYRCKIDLHLRLKCEAYFNAIRMHAFSFKEWEKMLARIEFERHFSGPIIKQNRNARPWRAGLCRLACILLYAFHTDAVKRRLSSLCSGFSSFFIESKLNFMRFFLEKASLACRILLEE